MFINDILSNNVYVYQSWEKLGAMGVSSRTTVISLTSRKGDKEDITNNRLISLLNLDCKFTLYNPQESHLRNLGCNDR